MQHKPRGRGVCAAVILTTIFAMAPCQLVHATSIFINELHYDNAGGDTGEAVEIAGPAGTNLAGWSLALYNGSPTLRSVYNTISLSGIISNQHNGFGSLSFTQTGIQNGSPDGLALVNASNMVIQFLSYEGSFVAASGPATGLSSTDIGVSELNNVPIGNSLQLTGTGNVYADFSWASSAPNTFGSINTEQTFLASTHIEPVPEPSTLLLFGTGLLTLLRYRNWIRNPQKIAVRA